MGRGLVNTAEVDRRGLCTECGSCEGMCPFKNVRLEQAPGGRYHIHILNSMRCEKCPGVCLQVCPGYQIDVDALNQQIFGEAPSDYLMGNYRTCYLGYTTDPTQRERGTSGGVTSGLIAFAIESGCATGAYVVRDVPGRPFSPSIELAKNREDIRAAAGTKYWPVPLGRCLGEILRSKTRIVFVGLPCEITAMRKAEAAYPQLRAKIAFSIGLFCGRRATIQGHIFTLARLGIPLPEVTAMRYREGQYPGHLAVYMRSGQVISVPRNKQLAGYAGHLFLHQRCLLCHDGLSELADISVGDAMGVKVERKENENSVVIARTELGAEVLDVAARAGAIHLRSVDKGALLESKKRFLGEKRYSLWARVALAKRIPGWSAPDIRLSRPSEAKPLWEDYARGLATLVAVRMVRHEGVRAVLQHLPNQWLEKYSTYGSASDRISSSAQTPKAM